MNYAINRAWSDRYIPGIKRIVGPRLLVEAPLELDCAEATDLIVFKAEDKRIAARMRRADCLARSFAQNLGWEHQFTIRSHHDSGYKTEYAKIIDGFGDWMFYGHALDDESLIIDRWMLLNLHAFRAALIRRGNGTFTIRCGNGDNQDGTYFKWFDARSFPIADPSLLVDTSELEAERERAT